MNTTIGVIALSLVLLLLASGVTLAIASCWNNAGAISHALGRISAVDRRVQRLEGGAPEVGQRTRPLIQIEREQEP